MHEIVGFIHQDNFSCQTMLQTITIVQGRSSAAGQSAHAPDLVLWPPGMHQIHVLRALFHLTTKACPKLPTLPLTTDKPSSQARRAALPPTNDNRSLQRHLRKLQKPPFDLPCLWLKHSTFDCLQYYSRWSLSWSSVLETPPLGWKLLMLLLC